MLSFSNVIKSEPSANSPRRPLIHNMKPSGTGAVSLQIRDANAATEPKLARWAY